MSSFITALTTVGIMLFYAIPGFLLIKSKLIKSEAIPAFAKLLMYVCSPMLVINSITSVDFSIELMWKMIFSFLFILVVLITFLLVFSFVFKKKESDPSYRIFTLCTSFSNCGFMGVPILQALLPHYPEAVVISAMFSLAMNILGWTVASYVITRDRKYMSIKKIILNPAVIALFVALPLLIFGVDFPSQIDGMISLLARMTTPLCMLIMGMRLACAPLKDVFTKPQQYLIALIKQIALPLLVLLILLPLPIEHNLKLTIYILFLCPVASVILTFAEMLGQGQRTAANMVLLSTSLSAITIPIMCLLI
ncbi:MAG: AEC family transporter [Clostridia bacterium]|nr:AEC family transporter [Clostridia bacterium]